LVRIPIVFLLLRRPETANAAHVTVLQSVQMRWNAAKEISSTPSGGG
jgi:hypothetical protein